MTETTAIFHFDKDRPSFEDLGRPNGITHWTEETLMEALGYQTKDSFNKAVLKAKQACLTLGWETEDHFSRAEDGTRLMTRFACYLVAMNGDTKKPEVAAAQAYFAALAETFQSHLQHVDGLDRIQIREDIKVGNKSLSSTASRHGVENFAYFQDAGYVGMYNMNLNSLIKKKGVKKGEQFIDRMSRAEMAANLFRITQTEEKIKRDNVRGQGPLQDVAKKVGRIVRNTMIEAGSAPPESLPLAENVKDVKKKLKGTGKNLQNIDKKPRKK